VKAVDVMGFAGSFAVGVDQAGFEIVSKREPDEFRGFGMDSVLYNMPWIDGQVGPPEDWDGPVEPVDLLFGCPPCSGFSQLSHANTLIHGAVVGPDAEINKCMFWLVDYASRVKPRVVIMESVGVAFKSGRDFMEGLWARLVDQSGVDYYLTHVNMNAAWVGGDVIRPRYFFVASTEPFGIGREFVEPRTAWEVLQDLPAETDDDEDWGHLLKRGSGPERWVKTLEWLKENGREWRPGTRLPDNNDGLEPPEFWVRADQRRTTRMDEQLGSDHPSVYSHWYSTDPFSTYRWHPDRPFGVVVAAVLERAIHPVHDRPLTFREAARFMSIPDNWSMASLVRRQASAELGKAVPSASGKWIAHWARMAIEGTPGEYAGVADTEDDRIRVINAQTRPHLAALANPPSGTTWDGPVADPDPATWLIDRRERPDEWWQRDEAGGWSPEPAGASRRQAGLDSSPAERSAPPVAPAPVSERAPGPRARSKITRIEPEVVQKLLDDLEIDKKEAAARLGVSVSRVHELTTHNRPNSWLNAERWDDVRARLGA
jgi:site-specific DNA-cytosine methylase